MTLSAGGFCKLSVVGFLVAIGAIGFKAFESGEAEVLARLGRTVALVAFGLCMFEQQGILGLGIVVEGEVFAAPAGG